MNRQLWHWLRLIFNFLRQIYSMKLIWAEFSFSRWIHSFKLFEPAFWKWNLCIQLLWLRILNSLPWVPYWWIHVRKLLLIQILARHPICAGWLLFTHKFDWRTFGAVAAVTRTLYSFMLCVWLSSCTLKEYLRITTANRYCRIVITLVWQCFCFLQWLLFIFAFWWSQHQILIASFYCCMSPAFYGFYLVD